MNGMEHVPQHQHDGSDDNILKLVFPVPASSSNPAEGASISKAFSAPLAARMRPRTLAEFIGQEHILSPGLMLHRDIEADRIQSLVFYGPPGTGKTSLASLIATSTKSHFER